MIKYYYSKLTDREKINLCRRPAIDMDRTNEIVKPVLDDVKRDGLPAVLKYAEQFDGFNGGELLVSEAEFAEAVETLDPELKIAMETAARNIRRFHEKQFPAFYETETMPGVKCSREYRPIDNVGLYIPGGSAVLPSTMLMLGIPASIAGCSRIIACSPAKEGKINAPVLYAAKLCGVTEFYKIGGAQAVGLMAYGTEGIKKVNKIFGPGNQYVTAAKILVSSDINGCAIDMPAGPSEVLVIADEGTDASFAAADLLSQAEHGADSQAVLVVTSESKADEVLNEISSQTKLLPRRDMVLKALQKSVILITDDLKDAVEFSNMYAPEHLILNFKDAFLYKEQITNAGSVFIGEYSPESAGDYASGTNHSLPTYGYAGAYSGVTVEQFMKSISFQNLTREGLNNLSNAVIKLAEAEGLDAHKRAVTIRLERN